MTQLQKECNANRYMDMYLVIKCIVYSKGNKVEKNLTLAPERYIAGFCMVAKVILWRI